MRTQEQAKISPKRGDLWKQNKDLPDDESHYILVIKDADEKGSFRHAWKYVQSDDFNYTYTDVAPDYWISENLYLGNVLTADLGVLGAVARKNLGVEAPTSEALAPDVPAPAPDVPAPAPAPRKIVDVVSDEARETRARIEDEVAEVKEALRLLTSAQSKFDLVMSENWEAVRDASNVFADEQTQRHLAIVDKLADLRRDMSFNHGNVVETIRARDKWTTEQGKNVASALVGIDRLRSEMGDVHVKVDAARAEGINLGKHTFAAVSDVSSLRADMGRAVALVLVVQALLAAALAWWLS